MVNARLSHGPIGNGIDAALETGPAAHVTTRSVAGPTAYVTAELDRTEGR